MKRLGLLAALASTLFLLSSARSFAQEAYVASTAREPTGYREAIDAAIEEFNAGNYEEAREQFDTAHRLLPSARTLRGLGLTGFELRHYSEAVTFLRQALACEVRPLEGAMLTDTEAFLQRAEGYLGTVKLEIQLEPAAVTLLVDGETREYVPTEPLVLAVGDHLFEFRATGRATERRTAHVQGRQVLTIQVALPALTDSSNASASSGERQPGRTPVYKRWWFWTSIGVVAAGAVVAGVLATRHNTVYEPATTENTPIGISALSPLVEAP